MCGLFVSLSSSCIEMMQDASDADDVKAVTATLLVSATDADIPTGGLDAVLTNVEENFDFHGVVADDGYLTVEGLVPGVYTLSVSGESEKDGTDYFFSGLKRNITLTADVGKTEAAASEDYQLVMRPSRRGPLVIKEVFYTGGKSYYSNHQYVEIYNNSNKVYYADKLCFGFCHKEPNWATPRPVWPAEDEEGEFLYVTKLYMVPGTGRDYPLNPGESIIFARVATNHPAQNIDLTYAEFELWTGNEGTNFLAPEPVITFWEDITTYGNMFNTMGPMFVIYQPDMDQVGLGQNDPYWYKTGNWAWDGDTKYPNAKYPRLEATKVIDAVEAIDNATNSATKRLPGNFDAGYITSNGRTFQNITFGRKIVGTLDNGKPLFQDTNNSTEDFEEYNAPAYRRHGSTMPAWNWSRK